ncbi:MAG: methionine synthase, partial [Dehalococcoidales bacterium]|nr:methionine synthase [Dehalococcoidales bacterium]
MNVQYSEGFPGLVVDSEAKRIFAESNIDLSKPLEEFYTAYLGNDLTKYPISPDHASGLYGLLDGDGLTPRAVKGQVTGPVTWGMTVTDQERRPIIYDETLGDVVAKLLRLKASWQEKELSRISKNTIIFVDEPYMAAFGSVGFLLTKEQVISLLEEVFSGISGLSGVHCCGNTDWSILLATSVDILSFDTYNYADSLSIYPAETKRFLDRGGAIAWGIIPTDEESIGKESVASLRERLEEAIAPFTRQGVPFKQLIAQGLLTPSCGLATLTSEAPAERALELLAELSTEIRKRYL